MKTIALGSKVRDVITNIEGIAIGRTTWLTGCDQYIVKQQTLDKDGKQIDGHWFDVQRLLVLEPPSDAIRAAMTDTESPPGGEQQYPHGV